MKLLLALLFTTAFSFAQSDVMSQFKSFETELETYRANPEVSSENSTIKSAPCGQYVLKFMVSGSGDAQVATVPPPRKLCYDLNRFDKNKNANISPDWTYDIKPIGNKYYVIRAEKKGATAQEAYYYERLAK